MKYSVIQNLKKQKKYQKEQINFARAICTKLYPNGKIYTLKCCLFYLLCEYEIEYINNGKDILINNYLKKREDYNEIMVNLKKILENKYNLLNLNLKYRPVKSIIKLFFLIKKMICERIGNIRIASLILMLEDLLKELKKTEFKEKILITFFDSNFEENLLTQYFKEKGKKTITLQHGQYRCLEEGKEDSNIEAYKNFLSDYIFVWGEKTKNELLKVGIEEKKIKVVGALKDFKSKKYAKKNKRVFTVILDGENNFNSNINLIKRANEISNELKMKYQIRYHPMNKKRRYYKYIKKEYYLQDGKEILSSNFYILHMTSVFIELLANSQEMYIYDDEYQQEIFKISGITFSDLKSFKKIYKNSKIDYKKIYGLFNRDDIFEKLKQNYIEEIKKII